MKVYIAKEAGFCFGVKRALNLIERLHEEGNNIQVYGQLIHNRTVLNKLNQKGIGCIQSLEEFTGDQKLVIRTHGIPKEVEDRLHRDGISVVDATCPFVKKIHHIIGKLNEKKNQIVIVGNENHPEVIAAKSYAHRAVVIDSLEEAQKLEKRAAISVVAQTTLSADFFKEIVSVLLDKADKLEIYNTICHATVVRQEAVKELAPQVDFVVVIGGKNSSNTRKLFDIALKRNKNTFHIEKNEDLYDLDFINRVKSFHSVGITAGASTPPEELHIVKDFFRNFNIENIEKEMKNGRIKRHSQH